MSGRYVVKSGCAFLCIDVLGRNCRLDVSAGGVLLRFLAAASTISVTLSHCDCLSWRKAFSGLRGCMSIGVIGGDCIATTCPVCGLGCSNICDCENTGGGLVMSRFAGPDEVFGIVLLDIIGAAVRPTTGIGVKILGGVAKKLK